MPTWPQYKETLHDLYGVEFPDALWQLHVFFKSLPKSKHVAYFDALAMSPTGPLQLLDLPLARLKRWKPRPSALLHWRFYRDPPEFFSCLHGDTDGLHWGLLLDTPDAGFRGAASYYNNDGDEIAVYRSLFDAVLYRLESSIQDFYEMCEDDPDGEGEYRSQIVLLKDLKQRFREYVRANKISLSDHRPAGVKTGTGLDVIVPGARYEKRWDLMDAKTSRAKPAATRASLVKPALAHADKGDAYPALSLGRSLWYWGAKSDGKAALQLLTRAYQLLDRPMLLRVLDVHHAHRDLPNVDLLTK
jgi:hypothetical protein